MLKFFLNFSDDSIDPAMADILAHRFSVVLRQICCYTDENVLSLMRREDEN